MPNTKVETKNIIVNGCNYQDTISTHAQNGYIFIHAAPATIFHPYAMETDHILFFAKPIDKVEYDREMKDIHEVANAQ